MRCPSCGMEVPRGDAFCSNCGTPMPRPGESGGRPRAGYDDYGYESPVRESESRSRGFLYALIGFLSVLLIAIAILILTNMTGREKDEGTAAPAEPTTVVVTASPAPATPAPTTAPTPAPTPDYSAEEVTAVKAAVGNYLAAYVADMNDETYSRLYSYIQAGSSFETQQRNFIYESAPKDLRESIQEYQITSVSRQADGVYYVTSVETYSYSSNEDSGLKWVKQQCTYQVNRQGDGSWKLSSMIGGVTVLGRGSY